MNEEPASGTILDGTIDRYRLGTRIGEGGIGTVWRAQRLSNGEKVAVKILHSKRFQITDAVLERFRREIKHGLTLKHDNLISVIDFREPERGQSFGFLIMNLVDGTSLDKLIPPLSPEARRTIALGIIDGLEYLHGQEMIHRDLKPSNIIVRKDGNPVICDFGLMKTGSDQHVTDSTEKIGSQFYMSSNQSRNPAKASAADDVYSLCACFFELFSEHKMSIRWHSTPIIHAGPALKSIIYETLSENTARNNWPVLKDIRVLILENESDLLSSDLRQRAVGSTRTRIWDLLFGMLLPRRQIIPMTLLPQSDKSKSFLSRLGLTIAIQNDFRIWQPIEAVVDTASPVSLFSLELLNELGISVSFNSQFQYVRHRGARTRVQFCRIPILLRDTRQRHHVFETSIAVYSETESFGAQRSPRSVEEWESRLRTSSPPTIGLSFLEGMEMVVRPKRKVAYLRLL